MPGRRRRLPPLERKFGLFCCGCGASWGSAYVSSIRGTKKVYFKQKCRQCRTARNPYKVSNLQCPNCGIDCHLCTCTGNHGDIQKGVHRSDLCQKCLAGYPCQDQFDDC